jgi:hypothetical protein
VEGANDRRIRLLDGEDRQDRRERRVHVDDVVVSAVQHLSHLTAQSQSDGDARLRSVRVHRLASTEANDVRLRLGAGNVRRDDVDVMSAPAGLPGEEVHVLAHAAEVGIIVLRDQRDAQGPLVVRVRQNRKIRERWLPLKRGATGGRRQKRMSGV